jgi:hypothetical protein
MPPLHLALVTETQGVALPQLTQVAAAIQKQIVRDFAPFWEVEATCDAFARLDEVPVGYWPLIVQDAIGVPEPGVHRDPHGQPLALIRLDDDWERVVSHEALELLADPTCAQVVAGDSPLPDQGRVEFLREVCDPCGDAALAYTVNGVRVSDFCTPSYFDPVAAPGTRYDFQGKVTQPREVLRGGYLSWRVPETGDWWQLRRFDAAPQFVNLGPLDPAAGACLRGAVDRVTEKARRKPRRRPARKDAAAREKIARATAARAAGWRRLMADLAARAAGG